MCETRELAAILVLDVVGYSRLAGRTKIGILARLRTASQRPDRPHDPLSHHGRVVCGAATAAVIESRSVVDAVRCAIELQNAMVERNAGVPEVGESGSGSVSMSATWSRRATAT